MLALERSWVLLFLLLLPLWFLLRRLLAPALFLPLSLRDSEGRPAPGEYPLSSLARRLRVLLGALGFVFLVLAASGPGLLRQSLGFLERGDEILFVLDVSPSMAAEDFKPTRLGAASSLIERFLSTRRNEAVGLVAFGGEAALLCPPTLDYRSVEARLESLKPGMFGEGTALGAGIAVAASHGSGGAAKARHIVVLTDGENNAGSLAPQTAAGLARDAGFDLTVVGVGRRGPVPLTYVDPATGGRRSGTYQSAFDPAGLEAIARKGGGAYFDAADRGALETAFAAISEGSTSLTRTRSLSSVQPLGPALGLLALLALGAARLLGLVFGEALG